MLFRSVLCYQTVDRSFEQIDDRDTAIACGIQMLLGSETCRGRPTRENSASSEESVGHGYRSNGGRELGVAQPADPMPDEFSLLCS